jgi:hypothetical protein
MAEHGDAMVTDLLSTLANCQKARSPTIAARPCTSSWVRLDGLAAERKRASVCLGMGMAADAG